MPRKPPKKTTDKQEPEKPPQATSRPYKTGAEPDDAYILREPAVEYVAVKPPANSQVSGGVHYFTDQQPAHDVGAIILHLATKKPESHMTPLEKMELTRNGLSKRDLETLKEKTSLDYDTLASALAVTRATLINKKGDDKFSSALSERLLDLADLYSYGFEVFEEAERFNRWMARPNRALGGKAPYELLDNQFGRQEVRNIIGRIEYGVYS